MSRHCYANPKEMFTVSEDCICVFDVSTPKHPQDAFVKAQDVARALLILKVLVGSEG